MAARAEPGESGMEFVVRDRPALHQQGGPRDYHPDGYGKLDRRWYGQRGGLSVQVCSSARRSDGWSYNLALTNGGAIWIGFFHHRGTGKRVLHAYSDGSKPLQDAFEV